MSHTKQRSFKAELFKANVLTNALKNLKLRIPLMTFGCRLLSGFSGSSYTSTPDLSPGGNSFLLSCRAFANRIAQLHVCLALRYTGLLTFILRSSEHATGPVATAN